jgi:glycerophosphoryl diester phosphodiesterase
VPHPALRFGRPQVFAHRGGSALRPENTFAAFDHGLSLGADGLELDVHLSHDNVVVVHHDATLDRTTNGTGPIAARSAAELATLDAGWHYASPGFEFRGQAGGIPTLAEVLRRYRGISIIVELKVNDPAMAVRTIDAIRAAGALDRVAVGSFGTRVLRAARAYEPRLLTGSSREETRLALYRSWVRWPVRTPSYDAFQVPELSGRTRVVSPRFIRYAHESGLAVQVWTIDRADDMQRLLEWGVDGIITDRPDIAVDVVRTFHKRSEDANLQEITRSEEPLS